LYHEYIIKNVHSLKEANHMKSLYAVIRTIVYVFPDPV
jgi:hypothetical protein